VVLAVIRAGKNIEISGWAEALNQGILGHINIIIPAIQQIMISDVEKDSQRQQNQPDGMRYGRRAARFRASDRQIFQSHRRLLARFVRIHGVMLSVHNTRSNIPPSNCHRNSQHRLYGREFMDISCFKMHTTKPKTCFYAVLLLFMLILAACRENCRAAFAHADYFQYLDTDHHFHTITHAYRQPTLTITPLGRLPIRQLLLKRLPLP